MKKFQSLIALAVLLVGFSPLVNGQKFEGKILYGMTYENLPAEMEGYESMLPKESTFYLKGDNIRFEQDMGMAGQQTIIFNNKAETGFMLMNMMGQKMQIDISPSQFEDGEEPADPEIKYLKDTKKVAGYKCKLAKVTVPTEDGSPAQTSMVWYTEDIQGGHNQYKTLKGFPLEYSSSVNGMEVTVTAKDVTKEKLSDSYFAEPDASEGYEKMTIDELQGAFGGGR